MRSRWSYATLVALLAWIAVPRLSIAGEPATTVRRFALVIGSNHTLDDSQSPLRFADDDAARMTELLRELGVDTELVATLDRDTQATFPRLVAGAQRPDRAGVDAAWARLRTSMDQAQRSGAATELILYYSGHGDIGPDGQGYLTLDGDRLTREDLFGVILATSPANTNHLLIDACRSESFVLSRGKGEWKNDRTDDDHGREVAKYLQRTQLSAFPNTGVLLAHSADQQTHEWERYRGGVFSHQLLSGLRGGADLNGDGSIEYSELAAFVSAANHGVEDPRARLDVVVRPPAADERHPVIVHDDLGRGRVLLLPAGDAHRYVLEDTRGVRLADVRRSGEQPAYVRLPDGEVFVHREGQEREEARVPADRTGVIHAGGLPYGPPVQLPRGALDQALRAGLFTTPYGPGYYAGYTARTGLLTVADPSWQGDAWSNVAAEPPKETEPEPAPPQEQTQRGPDTSRWWTEPRWGGIFFGTAVTPFVHRSAIGYDRRVTSDQFDACLSPYQRAGCSAVRGFDLRWQYFQAGKHHRYPRTLWYFRTGYHAGHAAFRDPSDPDGLSRVADSLGYVSVPLYLGGNIYLFDAFPVRPYAGLGFGLDVMRLEYRLADGRELSRVAARPGFELHAGIEGRITNRVAIVAEVQQLWSARRKIDGVPDFSNTGFTIVTGIAIGFPLGRDKTDARRVGRR